MEDGKESCSTDCSNGKRFLCDGFQGLFIAGQIPISVNCVFDASWLIRPFTREVSVLRARTAHCHLCQFPSVSPMPSVSNGMVFGKPMEEAMTHDNVSISFYFIGNAPQRFIVHASSTDFDGPKSPPNELAGQIHNEGESK
jgi:hypothetical protein